MGVCKTNSIVNSAEFWNIYIYIHIYMRDVNNFEANFILYRFGFLNKAQRSESGYNK